MSGILSKQTFLCEECNSPKLLRDYELGELVCQDCGLVVSSTFLNQRPEWRAFNPIQKDKFTRVGAPVTWTINDKGFSTIIGKQGRDASGKNLSPENRSKLFRLRKWNHRSKVTKSKQRNLSQAFNELDIVSYKLNLPHSVVETSSIIYRKALNKRSFRGRTIHGVIVASVYMACRQCGVIRTLEEVANAGNIPKKDVAKNYRFLLKSLKPRVPKANTLRYISRIVSNLDLSVETEQLAIQILSEASSLKLTGGRSPNSIAATCIYISTRLNSEHRTQVEVAREAQVTSLTIRNRYKELAQCLDFQVVV